MTKSAQLTWRPPFLLCRYSYMALLSLFMADKPSPNRTASKVSAADAAMSANHDSMLMHPSSPILLCELFFVLPVSTSGRRLTATSFIVLIPQLAKPSPALTKTTRFPNQTTTKNSTQNEKTLCSEQHPNRKLRDSKTRGR